MVKPRQEATVASAVNDVVVAGIRRQVGTLAARRALPIVVGDEPAARTGIDANGRVVLLRTVNAVREGIVGGHPVELGRWLIHVGRPRLTRIVTDLCTSVVGNDEAVGVVRCNPQIMVIPVGRITRLKGAPAIVETWYARS